MARPRAFHENQTLSRAMRVFWQQGYARTSMRDLTRATGLNASSLYNTWGDKDSLFQRVLSHYVEGIVQRRIDTYLTEGDPIQGIRRFLETTFDYIDDDTPPLACLLTNTSQELTHRPDEVNQLLAAGMSRVESAFEAALRRGSDRLPPGSDPARLAAGLAMGLQGLLISSRVTPDKTRLNTLTDAVMAPIESSN